MDKITTVCLIKDTFIIINFEYVHQSQLIMFDVLLCSQVNHNIRYYCGVLNKSNNRRQLCVKPDFVKSRKATMTK